MLLSQYIPPWYNHQLIVFQCAADLFFMLTIQSCDVPPTVVMVIIFGIAYIHQNRNCHTPKAVTAGQKDKNPWDSRITFFQAKNNQFESVCATTNKHFCVMWLC
jgi:hypothetical protein